MSSLRDKILDIAYEEIYTNGYSATGLNTILQKSNVAKGGLYHHFSSKKELIIAIINERICPNSVKKYSKLDSLKKDKLKTLLEILDSRNRDFDKGCPLGNLILELSNIDEDISKALQNCINSWQTIFEKVILEAIKNKEIKNISAYDSSLFIISTIQGGLLLSKLSKTDFEYKKCIKSLKIFFNL
ncbi:TetR/AcrR family transcriptional regulator [Aliarcobacter cryaerophilus]|uniref:TetR/AcrR family transcriptional regulator n=1 Tax=Aliarcobacter cryaerophilus TaxID=28198 RepID=UPI0021B1840B|nr:TetR/AcrR family transcriptional regulator [Aliarcobacter cryaerophilus]MCT7488187.1 TetR/AcrR family transcriptional regulator [Aliarcobacter cryaerophilus]MCT7505316.1 TetR/AcrR family transcriptional regulator [Aliarcobacter cryaerophilus]